MNRCELVLSVLFGAASTFMLCASYLAVSLIGDDWHAKDYWLAWFAGISLVGAAMCALTSGIGAYSALDCDRE